MKEELPFAPTVIGILILTMIVIGLISDLDGVSHPQPIEWTPDRAVLEQNLKDNPFRSPWSD